MAASTTKKKAAAHEAHDIAGSSGYWLPLVFGAAVVALGFYLDLQYGIMTVPAAAAPDAHAHHSAPPLPPADSPRPSAELLASAQAKAKDLVGGFTADECVATALALNAAGIRALMNFGGEHYTSAAPANVDADNYVALLAKMAAAGVRGGLSIKPSQLGLEHTQATFAKNLRRVVRKAIEVGYHVEVDTETADTRADTIRIFKEVLADSVTDVRRASGGVPMRIAAQCEYKDAPQLAAEVIALGGSVRVLKGKAYKEAMTDDKLSDADDIRENFMRVVDIAKHSGMAGATADKALVARIESLKAADDAADIEFQFLYGLSWHVALAEELVARGHTVAYYLPYGNWERMRGYIWRRHVLSDAEINALDVFYGLTQ